MAGTANSIITPQTPRSNNALVTTANTTYSTSPTNTVAFFTAGANGARVTRISAIPQATVTAAQLQLFRSRDNGTTKVFFNSALQAAYTMATTTAVPVTDFGYSDDNPLILQPNEVVYVASSITQNVAFNAEGADY
jgi:hypothetical protein